MLSTTFLYFYYVKHPVMTIVEKNRKNNSCLYIKVAKSFFNVPRGKLSPRPLVRPRLDNLEDVKAVHKSDRIFLFPLPPTKQN
jgi:hypothetical protein